MFGRPRTAPYAPGMNPMWWFAIGFAGLSMLSLLLGLVSADSRTGFDGRPIQRKDRWYYHSKTD